MIVAVDPGKVTGIATYGEVFTSWQEPTWHAVDRIFGMLEYAAGGGHALPIEAIVCESYVITAATLRKTRGENWSLESIGALRWMSNRHGVEFVLQTPADGKRFGTDDKLRKIGWYNPTPGGHANDAARHLLTYIARDNPARFKELLGVS